MARPAGARKSVSEGLGGTRKVHIGFNVERPLWETFARMAHDRDISAANAILRLMKASVKADRIPGLEIINPS